MCGVVVIVFRRVVILFFFFFQAEDGIRDLVRSRGLGDVYKRQVVEDGAGVQGHRASLVLQVLYPAQRKPVLASAVTGGSPKRCVL